jgi:hypothetical protein
MGRTFLRVNVFALALGAVLRAFDAAYLTARSMHAAVPADSLIHYNMLLGWWWHGDSPRGYTLTPSPYFIDIALQVPIALLAPDFERFSYVLALVYAVLIFASLVAVLRVVFDPDRGLALVAAAVAIVGFYTLAPFTLILHTFIYNHTSELFATLGLVALVHALFRPGARRRRYAPAVYVLGVAACIASSPFFVATYCIPASVGGAAALGTPYVDRRRLGWFLGLTALGAVAGFGGLAIIARYVWPVRGDYYGQTGWESYGLFKATIHADPRLWWLSWATAIAAVASTVLAIVGRIWTWSAPTRFMLTFFPACVAACVALPIKRGAFMGGYELRYVQLPWLLTAAFYAGGAAYLVSGLAARFLRERRLPRWLPGGAAALGVAGIALVVTAGGPLTLVDPASTTSSMIRCFADAEAAGAVHDGLATVWLARYLNAARLGPGWQSPYVIVQMYPSMLPTIDPRENNLVWFDGGYRGGQAKLDFLATHSLGDDVLRAWRDRLGAPDRTISCPTPIDLRVDGKPNFELWIWDREDAQRTLTEIVTRDNLRSPFSPVIGATSIAIDLTWGMEADPRDGALVGGHRVWRRGVQRDGGSLANTRPLDVPSGRYRLEVELSAVPSSTGAGPVVEIVVKVERRKRIDRFPIEAGIRHAVMEINVENRGGPTSGDAVVVSVMPRAADAVELSGMTLTLIKARGIAPFQIFR